MLEQELKDIWRNSSQAERVKFDLSRLLIDLNNKMENIERSIQRRDNLEITGALIGILIFSYFAYEIPFPITKIACLLALIWFVYVIYKLKSIKKQPKEVDLSLSFVEQLEHQKVYMQKQVKLLEDVLYWYVLPPFMMNILFIIGLGDPVEYDWSSALVKYLPISMEDKIVTSIVLAIFYTFIVWINKRSAKKTLKPVINDIERVQKQLKSEF